MKKAITLLSALIFSIALMIPSLMLADDGKHMEEGSGGKEDKSSHGEYKDKEHAEGKKSDMKKEGSDAKKNHDESAEHKKKEEGSKEGENKESH